MFSVVTRAVSMAALHVVKHAPTILHVMGTASSVAASVCAAKATTRIEETIAPERQQLAAIKQACAEGRVMKDGTPYEGEDSRKDTITVTTRIAVKCLRLYAPTIGFLALSAVCHGSAAHIMSKRVVALSGALASSKEAYGLLKGKYENALRAAGKDPNEPVIEVFDEEAQEATGYQGATRKAFSMYAVRFAAGNENWCTSKAENDAFLSQVQNYFNNRLKSKGFVFLNEVYKALGAPETPAGQLTGWLYGNAEGDDFIDLGIGAGKIDAELPDGTHVVEYVLDPNVHGEIWEMI